MRKKTLAVDFDGTIVDHAFPEIGALKPGVKEALTKLSERYEIIISSCRASALFQRGPVENNRFVQEMIQFLKDNAIPHHAIDLGDRGKVVAHAYIDDRAITFKDNWPEITEQLL